MTGPVVIIIEGGVVQDVFTDAPYPPPDVVVVDHDGTADAPSTTHAYTLSMRPLWALDSEIEDMVRRTLAP